MKHSLETQMNRDEFLKRPSSTPTIDVPLPDGRTVKVRKLSQSEVEHMGRHYSDPKLAAQGLRYVVVRTLVGETGERLLDDKDLDQLAGMDFEIIKTIAAAATEFSGLKVPNESAA